MPQMSVMHGVSHDGEAQTLVECFGPAIALEHGQDEVAPRAVGTIDDRLYRLGPDTMALKVGRDADCVDLNRVLILGEHDKPDVRTVTNQNRRPLDGKLTVEFRQFLGFVAAPPARRNTVGHGGQEAPP